MIKPLKNSAEERVPGVDNLGMLLLKKTLYQQPIQLNKKLKQLHQKLLHLFGKIAAVTNLSSTANLPKGINHQTQYAPQLIALDMIKNLWEEIMIDIMMSEFNNFNLMN